jgi:putative spermidine/putrescine transport system permease protein
MPAIRIGVTVVFLYNMAAFIAPAVLGGPSDAMVGQLIESEIESGLSWGFAAALAIVLVGICLLVVALITLLFRRTTRWQNPRNDAPARVAPAADPLDPGTRIVAVKTRPSIFNMASRPGVLRGASAVYLVLIATYVLGPLVVVIPISFTSAASITFPPPGWSTQWYVQAATDGNWVGPLVTSLEIAAATTALACTLALVATLGFGRTRGRGQGVAEATLNTPLMVPAVVYALGAYLFFAKLHLIDTFIGITLAESILVLPISFLIINTAYRAVEPALERAAASLGAGPITTLRRVVIPLMRPGLLTAALLCMLLTIDEAVVSVFLSNVNVVTLARQMWEGLRFNTSPEIAAVSTVLVAIAVVIVVVSFAVFSRLSDRRNLVEVLARGETVE